MSIVKGTLRTMTVHREGARVILLGDGRAVFDLPWKAALDLARALHIQGKKAEEEARATRIIMDQAILMRAGAPISLTGRADILHEAGKEAAWNSNLRRYMPNKMRKGVVGKPNVIKEKPDGR